MLRLFVFIRSRSVEALDLVERNDNEPKVGRPVGTAPLQGGGKPVGMFSAVFIFVELGMTNDFVIELQSLWLLFKELVKVFAISSYVIIPSPGNRISS